MKLISAKISTDIKFIFWTEIVIQFCIQVIEIIPDFFILWHKRPDQRVNIGSAGRNKKGCFVFDNRDLQTQNVKR
jgi:hypothetical protein